MEAPRFSDRPRQAPSNPILDPRAVRVRIETPFGEMTLEIDLERAPASAGAFLRLVDQGRYDGATFFRTIRPDNDPASVSVCAIQAVVAASDAGLPGIPHEPTCLTGISHGDGVISLARGEVGDATAESFFICIGDQPELDFGGARNPDGQGFAAFGRVTEGLEAARQIHRGPVSERAAPSGHFAGQLLAVPVELTTVRRVAI